MNRAASSSRLAQRVSIGLAGLTLIGAVGLGGYNLASADVADGDRPIFVPISPCRLLDTRAEANVGARNTPLGGPEQITVTAHGSNGRCTGVSTIPNDAVGLSMNVVSVRPSQRTFLTFWGSGVNPGTANLNPEPGQAPTPNAVNTPLSPTGTFNLYNNAGSVEVIIDVNGYYANHNHDDRYLTEAETGAEIDALEDSVGETVDALGESVDSLEASVGTISVSVDALDGRIDTIEDNVPVVATGIVRDTDTAAPVIQEFEGPPGTTASLTSGAEGSGGYTVTINGLTERIDGVVQITAFGDEEPGVGSRAGACSVAYPITSTTTTFSFDVGCFGENDALAGNVSAEDTSFQFLIVG